MCGVIASGLVIVALVLGAANPASAAMASAIDEFNPNANGAVHGMAIQSDNKIVIGGAFTKVGNVSFNRVARINIDGSVDAVFSGLGANGNVLAVALQKDGKILVGGLFTSVGGAGRNRIARLYQNGSLDASFNPGGGANGAVNAIAVQPDGRILIAGNFTSVNGVARLRIARLNSNGSLDDTFNAGADKAVNVLAVQPGGKILVGGSFAAMNGSPRALITRLDAGGALDASFAPLTTDAGGASVNAIAVQPDGRILVGGSFYSINGAQRHRIARLRRDGALDMDFSPAANSSVNSIAIQPDGRILIGGSFVNVNGMRNVRIARLNPDGTPEAAFNSGAGAINIVRCIAIQADGKALIAGDLTGYDGAARNHVARLNHDGSLEKTCVPGSSSPKNPSYILAMAVQPDGKVLLGGYLGYNDYTVFRNFRRFRADGVLDATFNPAAEPRYPSAITLQPDDKILIAGTYQPGDLGTQHDHLDRLNPDGSRDTTFKIGSVDNMTGKISALAIQPDGKVFVAGTFTQYNGVARDCIARLHPDGSVDWTFHPGTGPKYNALISAIALQPDGKVVVAGDFTSFNGTPRNRIARLNPDGVLDTAFNPGTGANDAILGVAIQPDGKIVATGEFSTFNGVNRLNIVRLNANGSLDSTFKFTESTTRDFDHAVLLSDGKFIASGAFTIARLNADGSFDHAYVARSDVNAIDGEANGGLVVQPDGKALIGGEGIKTILGQLRDNVARVSNPDAATQEVRVDPAGGTATWILGGSFPWPCMVQFEESADGRAWKKLGTGIPIDKVGYRLAGLKLPIGKHHYVRATGSFSDGGNISTFRSTARFYESSPLYNAAGSWILY